MRENAEVKVINLPEKDKRENAMSNSYDDAVSRLASQSDAIGRLAQDSGGFSAIVAAFEAKDASAFRWVLDRLEMLPYCELICEWVRIKFGVLRCLEVCGLPDEELGTPNLQQFARAIVQLASNEALLRRVVDAVACGDGDDYHAAVAELNLNDFCYLLCHWIYSVIYYRVCEVVCSPARVLPGDPVSEIRAAAKEIAGLLKNEKAFNAIGEAAAALNCVTLQSTINQAGLASQCGFICRLICSWRYVWVCREFCQLRTPVLAGSYGIEEARNFALASRQLGSQPRALADLVSAVQSRDAKAYAAIIDRYGLGPYCYQVCAWACSVTCFEFCYCVCPGNADHPWFTNVGDFSIINPGTDIDTTTGLTLHPKNGHGGPNFAFYDNLSLGGFCPYDDPAHPSEAMAYRFLFQPAGVATPTPIASSYVYGLNGVSGVSPGYRYTLWHGNPNTLQRMWITGTGVTSPTPPIFTPSPTPPDHYIVPDANGWVYVDQNSLGGIFDGYLMGFSSNVAFPGGPPTPGVSAGTVVPTANQNNGVNAAIIFQATRVSTVAAVNGGAAPDYTNQVSTIHINNWEEVNELNFAEFANGCCTPIDKTLSVEFTVDHEQMGAGSWSLAISSCATVPPPNPLIQIPPPPSPIAGATFTAAGRGGAGTIVEDTSAWCNCSYTVTLATTPGLTNGLVDRSIDDDSLTFAICDHSC